MLIFGGKINAKTNRRVETLSRNRLKLTESMRNMSLTEGFGCARYRDRDLLSVQISWGVRANCIVCYECSTYCLSLPHFVGDFCCFSLAFVKDTTQSLAMSTVRALSPGSATLLCCHLDVVDEHGCINQHGGAIQLKGSRSRGAYAW